ncbi:hypothetical protein ILUMI_04822 [Ignelater luminosus]|uniref:Glutathione S-transferase n=1 Tax=Ignelater luminosus TaxID=2038154 RepID=A0A8K0GIP4_IGNLU|nr:hypothetical protein ILUMI_04822 [Ignelater luminosus]
MAPIKLYLFNGSPGVRSVLITAKAIGIDLELHQVDFFKQEHLSPEYLKINPQHSVPTLDDNGIAFWDSHAINAYLVRKYGKDDSLYPKDFLKRAIVDQRLHFDSGVLFPLLKIIDVSYFKKEITEVPPRCVKEINEAYQFLEKFLESHQWIAGDNVTIADFSLVTTITSLNYHVKIDPEFYPNVTGWVKKAQELACFSCDHEQLKHFYNVFNSLKGIK